MLGSLGWQELVLILAIVGLVAGGGRVADLGGQLGRGMREFRRGLRDDPPDPASPDEEPPAPPPPTPNDGG